MGQEVIEIRKYIEEKLYAHIVAFKVSWHLKKEEKISPSLTTINRIIKCNNLVHKRPKYNPKGINYPAWWLPIGNLY